MDKFPTTRSEVPDQSTSVKPCSSNLGPQRHNQPKNLTCGICQDVYHTPKILPCFHTFCMECLEQLIDVNGDCFLCPACRNVTYVPQQGAQGFQSNMYITESELERAKQNLHICEVHTKYDEPLTFFCITCDEAICLRCKLTKHDGHRCEDLTKAMRRHKQLAGAKRHLDETVCDLEKSLQATESNLSDMERKRIATIEQIHAQHDNLMAMAARCRDTAIKDVDRRSKDIRFSLSSEKYQKRRQLHSYKQEQRRMHRILEDLAQERPSSLMGADRLLQTWVPEAGKTRSKMFKEMNFAFARQRPGLLCRMDTIQEDAIRQFIGLPFTLMLPNTSVTASEQVTKFYQCLEEGRPRQVHSLCVTADGNVHCMYGDATLVCNHWGKKSILPDASICKDSKVNKKFIFRKFSGGTRHCISDYRVGNGIYINSKSGSEAQLHYAETRVESSSKVVASCSVLQVGVEEDPLLNQPKLAVHKFIQTIKSGKPIAMDISADKQLIAVVEDLADKANEGRKLGSSAVNWLVRLYQLGKEDSVSTYQPLNPHAFFPTDVCFWQCDGKEKLLVADHASDSVHVIDVQVNSEGRAFCHRERQLAGGCSDIVKPTALDTDSQGRLWVGCGNGWILKCQELPEVGESTETDEN